MQSIQSDFICLSSVQVRPNLTHGERAALRSLVADSERIICKADKGDTIFTLDTSKYLQLAHGHVNNEETYQLLQSDPTMEIAERFNKYLCTCRDKDVITLELNNKLKLPPRLTLKEFTSFQRSISTHLNSDQSFRPQTALHKLPQHFWIEYSSPT